MAILQPCTDSTLLPRLDAVNSVVSGMFGIVGLFASNTFNRYDDEGNPVPLIPDPNDPDSPAPDDAAIEAKGLTIRERFKQHATDQTCASCHARIDPLGFALESFDPIGRWREKYTSGLPIDSSGKLFGEAEFKDIEAFKDAILERPEKFMRAFSEHLLSYALGRELKITDKPSIDKITRRVMADHGRFSTVVVEIAKSIPFRHKTGQNESK